MSIESSTKILEYINKVSKEFMIVDENAFGYAPVDRVVLNESFFLKDDCKMCGKCCPNETTVWTKEGLDRINSAVSEDFEKWGLDFSSIDDIKSRMKTVVHSINGKNIEFYVSDRDSNAKAFKLSWDDRKEQMRCHWLFEKEGTYRCRIHPVRSVTCGMPHCRFFHSESAYETSTTIGLSQFGRNWALKCPVEFGSANEDSVQTRILWLERLNAVAEDCGIDTFLPEILEYLHAGNRSPKEFVHRTRKKLFYVD